MNLTEAILPVFRTRFADAVEEYLTGPYVMPEYCDIYKDVPAKIRTSCLIPLTRDFLEIFAVVSQDLGLSEESTVITALKELVFETPDTFRGV